MAATDHAAALRALAVQAKRLGLHRTAASLDLDAEEAARREAEAPTRTDAMRQIAQEYGFGSQTPTLDALDLTKKPDAPPPPAPDVTPRGSVAEFLDKHKEQRYAALIAYAKHEFPGLAQAIQAALHERDALRAERDAANKYADGLASALFNTRRSRDAAKADAKRLRAALEHARPFVEKWCHYQGNSEAFHKETLAPIDKALAGGNRG